MEVLVYNNDNLSDNDIQEIVTRIKVIMINENNEILLANSNGRYFLPGGHLECGESLIDCLNREVKEETGISLNVSESNPFFKIMHYTSNYNDSGLNRVSEIYYYALKTIDDVDTSSISLTDNEKKHGFNIVKVNFNDVRDFLTNNLNLGDSHGEVIINEILEALDKFKEFYGDDYYDKI